jgi:hypothetical membrane protein
MERTSMIATTTPRTTTTTTMTGALALPGSDAYPRDMTTRHGHGGSRSTHTRHTMTERLVPLALRAGIVAPLLFALVVTVDGLVTPGYSAYNEAISYLDLGAQGWIQRANFIVFGLLLLAFALGYTRAMRPLLPRRWRIAVATCFILSDLGWMMAGVFVPNAYLAPQNSGHALLHQVASILVFLPFALASLLQGARFVRTRGWRIYGGYCLVLGLIQAFFPIATTVYFIHPQIVGDVNSPGSGLFNRIALLIGPISWYLILGCVLSVRDWASRRAVRGHARA